MTRFRSALCRFVATALLAVVCTTGVSPARAMAQAENGEAPAAGPREETAPPAPSLDLHELIAAGGAIGIVIVLLSIAMVALIVEHALSIRRSALLPDGLAEQVHHLIRQRQYKAAENSCLERPSLLGHILSAGLAEVAAGYQAVEKAMEDRSAAEAARLFRKIDYLQIIGTLAPMLGLLGTVWGMIQAFLEFESKPNPQVAELAPGIYKALVTTLLGLGVAVPALAGFAIFRNRIDELVAEASQLAEHVFSGYKRALLARKKSARRNAAEPESERFDEPGSSAVGAERGEMA